MKKSYFTPLDNRSVIELSTQNTDGYNDDIAKFLQGLITKNIDSLTIKNSIYTLMLTPQGKFLFDFFIIKNDDKYLIDIHEDFKDDFIKKLKFYRLRSKIKISDVSDMYEVVSLIGNEVYNCDIENIAGFTYEFCNGFAYIDPRTTKLFARSIIKKDNIYQSFIAKNFIKGGYDLYDSLRIKNTIPEGVSDLVNNESFPLQFGLDKLNAIDFDKGCYVGQEVTTRSKHRGKNKKTVCTFIAKANIVAGDKKILQNDRKIGRLLSYNKNICLAITDNLQEDSKNKIYNIGNISLRLFEH